MKNAHLDKLGLLEHYWTTKNHFVYGDPITVSGGDDWPITHGGNW